MICNESRSSFHFCRFESTLLLSIGIQSKISFQHHRMGAPDPLTRSSAPEVSSAAGSAPKFTRVPRSLWVYIFWPGDVSDP